MAPKSRGGSGGISRRAAIALLGGCGLLSISTSGAFDQVDARRPFELSVDDENALLGVKVESEQIIASEGGVTKDLITLTNRFSGNRENSNVFTSVSVSASGSALSIESLRDVTILPGDSYTVQGDVIGSQSGEITLTITASTGDEQIETKRTISVYQLSTCPVSVSADDNALSARITGGSVSISNEDVDGKIDAGGDVTITGNGKNIIIIDGKIKSAGDVFINTNGKVDTIIVNGGINSAGQVCVTASGSITIGGAVNANKINITANGNGAITICGTADPDCVAINGNNASVTINGSQVADSGDGNCNCKGNMKSDDENEEEEEEEEEEETGPSSGQGPPASSNPGS